MVYQTTLRSGKKVIYYMKALPDTMTEGEYYSMACIPTGDVAAAKRLHQEGFAFFDRSIFLEVPLKKFRLPISPGKKFRFSITGNWQPEEIYDIAKDAFENDFRFSLDPTRKNAELKNELLYGFITDLRQKSTMATCLYQEQCLKGFNLWNICAGKGRILLGAVSSRYRNSGIAMLLYAHTVEAMKESGAYTLRDFVATSNLVSLNLHAMLIRYAGGEFQFGSGWDYFRKENNSLN